MYILKCSSLPFISVWVFRRPPMAVLHFYEAGGLHDSTWFLETRPWKCLIWNINHSLVLSPLFTSNCRYSWCQIWTVVSEWGIRESTWPGKEWMLSARSPPATTIVGMLCQETAQPVWPQTCCMLGELMARNDATIARPGWKCQAPTRTERPAPSRKRPVVHIA